MRGMVFWLAIGLFGTIVPAAADTLTINNYTHETPYVMTYNQSDAVCWIVRRSANLPSCSTETFDCVMQCKVNADG